MDQINVEKFSFEGSVRVYVHKVFVSVNTLCYVPYHIYHEVLAVENFDQLICQNLLKKIVSLNGTWNN